MRVGGDKALNSPAAIPPESPSTEPMTPDEGLLACPEVEKEEKEGESSMANQLPWDIGESIMLLEAYLKIEMYPSRRHVILKQLSADLRARAEKSGMKIDAVFRNVNGMNLQYERFRYMMTDGKHGFRGPIPKNFLEARVLYEKNRPAYEKILKEARPVEEETAPVPPAAPTEASKPVEEVVAPKEATKPAEEVVIPKEEKKEVATFSTRRPWDRWEWALLLEAYEEIQKDPTAKMDILQKLSDTLRARAIRKGMKIDDTFRNLNGMKLQYEQVLYAMTGGQKGLKGNLSKKFVETQNIYLTDKDWFAMLLRKAKRDAGIEMAQEAKKKAPIVVVDGQRVDKPGKLTTPKTSSKISLQGVLPYHLNPNIYNIHLSAELEEKLYGMKIHTIRELYNYMNTPDALSLPYFDRAEILAKLGTYLDQHRRTGSVKKVSVEKKNLSGESTSSEAGKKPRGAFDGGKQNSSLSAPYTSQKASALLVSDCEEPSLFGGTTAPGKPEKHQPFPSEENTLAAQIQHVLESHFLDGFAPMRINAKKFKRKLEETYGQPIAMAPEDLLVEICKVGEKRTDGRIYAKAGEKEREILHDVANALVALFDGGATVVYRDAFYEKYREELAKLAIYNASAMEDELKKGLPSEISCSYGAYRGKGVREDGVEIVDFIKASPAPIPDADILSKFWYIPKVKIDKLLNSEKKILHQKSTRFYYPNLSMTDGEKEGLRQRLLKEIWQKNFLGDADILHILAEDFPGIYSDVATFPPAVVRWALPLLYPDDFCIVGGNLSDMDHRGSAGQALQDVCKKYTRLTESQLAALRAKINFKGNYANVVMEVMVRISSHEWVRRDQIHWNPTIPGHIAKAMEGKECIPIQEISGFLDYPLIGVKWNLYVLESYLYKNDGLCPFQLLQASQVSASGVYGVIARRGSAIEDYEAAAIHLLARDDGWNTEKEALDRIVAMGLQSDRRMKNIEQITKAAKEERIRLKQ